MYSRLPKYETWAYFLLWSGGIGYSVYHVYLITDRLQDQLGGEDLITGWKWIGRKKDVADYEWRIWLPFLQQLSPWFMLHFFVAELLRWYRQKELLRLWYVLITAVFLVDYAGFAIFIALVTQPCLLLFAGYFGGRLALWTSSLPIIISLNFYQNDSLTEEQQVNLAVCTAWLHLRSLSFCNDLLDKKSWTQSNVEESPQILRLLSFAFYLPLMFLGPFVLYRDFEESICKISSTTRPDLWHRLEEFFANFVRFSGWMVFTEWALHFVYCNALQAHPEVLPFMNAWALNGLAYCIGQFFLNKYVVIYGLMGTLAQLDGIRSPPTPRCIAHVSLYSDMWRHFDRGFYNFLVSYVYIPLLKHDQEKIPRSSFKNDYLLQRLWCSSLSFVFVYVWHGLSMNILVWSICNFLGLSLETLARKVSSSAKYKKWEETMSPQNIRRWHALLTSPLFIMSALTMFYFFGGMEVGNVFVLQVVNGSIMRNSLLLFFSYCMCQVSIETKMTVLYKKNMVSEKAV